MWLGCDVDPLVVRSQHLRHAMTSQCEKKPGDRAWVPPHKSKKKRLQPLLHDCTHIADARQLRSSYNRLLARTSFRAASIFWVRIYMKGQYQPPPRVCTWQCVHTHMCRLLYTHMCTTTVHTPNSYTGIQLLYKAHKTCIRHTLQEGNIVRQYAIHVYRWFKKYAK